MSSLDATYTKLQEMALTPVEPHEPEECLCCGAPCEDVRWAEHGVCGPLHYIGWTVTPNYKLTTVEYANILEAVEQLEGR